MNGQGTIVPEKCSWRIQHDASEVARYRALGWWRDRSHLDEFLACVRAHPDKIAISAYAHDAQTPRMLTYGQLGQFVDRAARTLIELGIEPGDIVSLQLPNGWEFPVLALATMRVGAIPNPIPIIYREREVSFMVRHAASKMLVVAPEFRGFSHVDLARKIKNAVPTLTHIVTTGAPIAGLLNFEARFLEASETADKRSLDIEREFARRLPKADDLAVLLFTSGTTGAPKGAMHTHNTIWSSGRPVVDSLQLAADDVVFMASTMGHLTGFYWGMLLPLSLGQKAVYQDVWDANRLLDAIDREGISWTLSATPFALDLVEAQKDAPRRLTSFRAFVCGGASIPPAVARSLTEHLGVSLISLWGCTEVGICTIHKLGAPIEVLSSSDGMRVGWVDLRIVDSNLAPVEPGQEGRLQVRGPSIFAGYLNQADLTADLRTRDGWYDTGDIGRQTEDGGVRICGRSKDIIIRGGQNVPVVEIENELLKHPKVREIAIVAVPDARLGERGCAVVVADGSPPTLEELREWLSSGGMAKQFWPEQLEILDAMPRTPAGKVQKYILRERFARSGTGLN